MGRGGGSRDLIFLHESSSWVEIRLHAENQLHVYPGNGLKVYVWVGGGGPITLSLQLELCWVELDCDNNPETRVGPSGRDRTLALNKYLNGPNKKVIPQRTYCQLQKTS